MIEKVAVIGSGVIGAGWIARCLENGVNVVLYDPDPDVKRKIEAVLDNSRAAYAKLTSAPRLQEGQLVYADSVAEAVSSAELIIESVPERLEIKQKVYADIEADAPIQAIITSSTSGIMPSDLQSQMKHPQRFLVAHPFNPVYLLPLVELVGGSQTDPATIQRSKDIYIQLGMKPLHIKKEIEAFIADRLMEAVWRESLWLVTDGIASTRDVDDAIRYGFGLRWAQMGLFETFRVAGGEAGMRHFMEQFGPCLTWPWTKLTDVPEFNEELVDLITSQSDQQSGHYSIRELERIRDNNLIGIMRALKANDWGAGQVLAAYEKARIDAGITDDTEAAIDFSQAVRTVKLVVPQEWTDYNGHMNESRYLECFSNATDSFMQMVGVDEEYVKAGGSYFTVETHIRHLDEVTAGETVYVTTRLLNGQGKKMQLFHQLYHQSGRHLASGEHMLIHVNLETRLACEPGAVVREKLQKIENFHRQLEIPAGVGRAIGDRR